VFVFVSRVCAPTLPPTNNTGVSEPQEIRNEPSSTHIDWVTIQTPAGEAIVSGERHSEQHGISFVAPMHEHGTTKWTNVPRQPIPKLDDVSLWIGHQLNYERMPTRYQHMAPEGELIASLDGATPRRIIGYTGTGR
jgi:hypothetical protein